MRQHAVWQIDMEACVCFYSSKANTIPPCTVAQVTHDWPTWRISADGIQYSCWVTVWRALSSTCCSSLVLSSQLFSCCFKCKHIYSTHVSWSFVLLKKKACCRIFDDQMRIWHDWKTKQPTRNTMRCPSLNFTSASKYLLFSLICIFHCWWGYFS